MKNNKVFITFFVFAALAVGLVYSLIPHSVRYSALKEQGLRYVPLTVDSTFDHINFGAPRYRDVIDGTLIPGEMDTYEHKDGPILTPMLVPVVLAPFFAPFDSIFPGIIITDFVFPVLLFMGLFLALNAFTKNKWFALFFSYVILLFPQLFVLIPPSSLVELKALVFQFIPFSGTGVSELNFLARDSFIPGGPFFVLTFYFLYRAISDETRNRLFIALAGIFYGLLFYLYFFFWIFATIFLGILFLFFIFAKEYQGAKSVFFAGLTGIFVSIPFWINTYQLSQIPWYEDILRRQGIEEGRGIRWFLWKTYALHALMAGLAYYFCSKQYQKKLGIFLVALALTGIVAYNANIVSGWTLQSDHWGNKVFLIVNAMLWPPIFYYLWLWVKDTYKKKWLGKTAVIVMVVAALLLSTHVVESQIKQGRKEALEYVVSEGLMDAYEWLTANTPKDSVVMTPSIETNIELAAYTHNRIFQARAQNNLLSKKEVLDRWYITYTLFGIPAETFENTIRSTLGVFNFFTAEYNSRALDSSLRPEKYPIYQLPEPVIESLLTEYRQLNMPQKIPYRLDYLFVGPRERELGISTKLLERLDVLYKNDDIVIYEYK